MKFRQSFASRLGLKDLTRLTMRDCCRSDNLGYLAFSGTKLGKIKWNLDQTWQTRYTKLDHKLGMQKGLQTRYEKAEATNSTCNFLGDKLDMQKPKLTNSTCKNLSDKLGMHGFWGQTRYANVYHKLGMQ